MRKRLPAHIEQNLDAGQKKLFRDHFTDRVRLYIGEILLVVFAFLLPILASEDVWPMPYPVYLAGATIGLLMMASTRVWKDANTLQSPIRRKRNPPFSKQIDVPESSSPVVVVEREKAD
jgi:hypothetical protein